MSNLRRRRAGNGGINALVRSGLLVPSPPQAATGHISYGIGRNFIPAGAEAAAVLTLANANAGITLMPNTGFTIAMRVLPHFANTSATTTWLFGLANAANNQRSAQLMWNGTQKKWWYDLYDAGTNNPIVASAAVTFDAETVHTIVLRCNGSYVAMNVDGVESTPVANTATLAVGTYARFGSDRAAGAQFNGQIGSLVISPEWKSQGWVDNYAALAPTPDALAGSLRAGDTLLPLTSDCSQYLVPGTPPGATTRAKVVFDGNSMSVQDSFGAFPFQTWNRLTPTVAPLVSLAAASQSWEDMIADGVAQVDAAYDATKGRNILVAWEGPNAMTSGGLLSHVRNAAEAWADAVTYCTARRAAGFRVVLVTGLPSNTFNGQPRVDYNALMRANWQTCADALADVTTDPRIGDDGDNANATYFSDGTHLTAAGNTIVAGVVKAAIEGLL